MIEFTLYFLDSNDGIPIVEFVKRSTTDSIEMLKKIVENEYNKQLCCRPILCLVNDNVFTYKTISL